MMPGRRDGFPPTQGRGHGTHRTNGTDRTHRTYPTGMGEGNLGIGGVRPAARPKAVAGLRAKRMSVSPSPTKPGQEAAPAPLHQVYVTHCLQADSVRHHAGMSVRASSTTDAELLEFAFQYPAYE